MGFNYQNNVSKKGITRQEFEQHLNSNLEKLSSKKQEKYKQKALDIFTRFAGLNGDANILDESEQIQARAAFEALDRNENGTISRRDIRKGKNASETQQIFADNGYKASKFFMDTFDSVLNSTNSVGEIQYGSEDNDGNSKVTVHYTENTETTKDDGLTTYHIDNTYRIVQKDEILESQTNIYTGEESDKYVIDDSVDKSQKGLLTEDKTVQGIVENVTKPVLKSKSLTQESIKSGFFQYITQDKNFTGILVNGEIMPLPQGCEATQEGIKFDGQIYKMRGEIGNPEDILRFECDATKETLHQALAKKEPDDNVHRYHNHGDKVNEQSTYDAETGVINHGNDEAAVSQSQTFASMLMNNADGSTLTLDKQSGTVETTGEILLRTISSDNTARNRDNTDFKRILNDSISLQELISYLNAVQNEAQSVENRTGARKFAGEIDIDVKDLANIGQVFKKYAGADGKLQKGELQNLLNDLKKNSMTTLGQGDIDRYIGEIQEDTTEEIITSSEIIPTDKEIAVQKKRLPIFNKRFVNIQDLEKEVNAKVIEKTVDGKENRQIVEIKDKDNNVSLYAVDKQEDGSYKLGEKLILKTKDKFVTETRFRDEIINTLELVEDTQLPENLTAEYDNKGKLKFKLNGGDCSYNTAKVYVIRFNSQIGKPVLDELQKINLNNKDNDNLDKLEKLSDLDKQFVEKRAKELGLRNTNGSDYGWYYNETEYLHYLWDNETKEFIPKPGVSIIDENGNDLMKKKK